MNRYLILAVLVTGFVLGGCEKEGPMEKAGKEFDNAMQDVGDAFEPDRGAAEKAGEKIDEAVEDVKSSLQ